MGRLFPSPSGEELPPPLDTSAWSRAVWDFNPPEQCAARRTLREFRIPWTITNRCWPADCPAVRPKDLPSSRVGICEHAVGRSPRQVPVVLPAWSGLLSSPAINLGRHLQFSRLSG